MSKELIDVLKQAEAEGTITPKGAAKLKQLTSKKYSTNDYIRPIASGASFGLSDEIGAGFWAIPAAISTGTNPIAAYKSMRDDIRLKQDQFAADNPIYNFWAELGGGLLSGGASGVKAAGSGLLKQLPKLTRYAAIGGGEGALAGYGYSDAPTLKENAIDAGVGGLLGASIGTAIPVVSPYIGSGVKKGVQFIDSAFRGAPTRAGRQLANKLKADDISLLKAKRKIMTLPEGATIADIGGTNTKTILDDIYNSSSDKGNKIKSFVDARNNKQIERVRNSINEFIHPQSHGMDQFAQETVDFANENAAPIYRYISDKTIDPKGFSRFLDNPQISARFKDAKKIILSDESAPESVKNAIRDMTFDEFKQKPFVSVLDAIKRRIDFDMNTADPNEIRILTNINKKLVGMVDSQYPEYAMARQASGAGKQLKSAADLGYNAYGEDTNGSLYDFLRLGSESEKDAYRMGIANRMQNIIGKTRETSFGNLPTLKSKVFGTVNQKEILPEVLPFKDFKNFQRELNAESLFNQTKNTIGNSATAKRIAQNSNAGDSMVGDIAELTNLNSKGLLSKAADFIKPKGRDAVRDSQMVEMLLETDKKKIYQILENIGKNDSLAPGWVRSIGGKTYKDFESWLSKSNNRQMTLNFLSGVSGAETGRNSGRITGAYNP